MTVHVGNKCYLLSPLAENEIYVSIFIFDQLVTGRYSLEIATELNLDADLRAQLVTITYYNTYLK